MRKVDSTLQERWSLTDYSLAFALSLLAQSVVVSYSVASTPVISAGKQHTLTIKSDGTLWVRG